MQFSNEIAPKCGENCPISGRRKKAQNPVTSVAVVVFFGPDQCLQNGGFYEIV